LYASGGILMNANGIIFGPTYDQNSSGTIFQLAPSANGTWQQGTIYQFPQSTDTTDPVGDLIADSAGNLYGAAQGNSDTGIAGNVFRLSPLADGKWKYDILYNFSLTGDGPAAPNGSLVLDSAGNLYGTAGGGTGTYGGGTVYKLSPTASGYWNETTLYSFGTYSTDGWYPNPGLVIDANGNLYGTTERGGTGYGSGGYGGTVFELSPGAGGAWTETILHNFQGGQDGQFPATRLNMDQSGNLYGTTVYGGSILCEYDCGTVFKLSPNGSGGWTETIIHGFTGRGDGDDPLGGMVFDAAGNLYGTTSAGGSGGSGTVFELSPTSSGTWTEKVLYSFDAKNGAQPEADLSFDAAGNLYGTTYLGATLNCDPYYKYGGCGTLFKATPSSGGDWSFSTVHTFGTNAGDGSNPLSGVYVDVNGNMFTMTTRGPGPTAFGDGGTVVEIKP